LQNTKFTVQGPSWEIIGHYSSTEKSVFHGI
jgi:hypothetical protein